MQRYYRSTVRARRTGSIGRSGSDWRTRGIGGDRQETIDPTPEEQLEMQRRIKLLGIYAHAGKYYEKRKGYAKENITWESIKGSILPEQQYLLSSPSDRQKFVDLYQKSFYNPFVSQTFGERSQAILSSSYQKLPAEEKIYYLKQHGKFGEYNYPWKVYEQQGFELKSVGGEIKFVSTEKRIKFLKDIGKFGPDKTMGWGEYKQYYFGKYGAVPEMKIKGGEISIEPRTWSSDLMGWAKSLPSGFKEITKFGTGFTGTLADFGSFFLEAPANIANFLGGDVKVPRVSSATWKTGVMDESWRDPWFLGGSFAGEVTIDYTLAKGIYAAAGKVSATFPSTSQYIQNLSRAGQIYMGKTAIDTGLQIFKEKGTGGLGIYSAGVVSQLIPWRFGGSRGMKAGELEGTRTRFLAKTEDVYARTKLSTQFEGADAALKISSKRGPLNLETVDIFTGKPLKQQRFVDALYSKEMSIYRNKLVLTGSASQQTYLGTPAKDIDIYVTRGFKRPSRPFISDISTGQPLWPKPGRFKWIKPSYARKVKDVFDRWGFTEIDVHDMPIPGSYLSVKGFGYSQRPIKMAEGSIFGKQMRIGEQIQRKITQTAIPEHKGRAKDWIATTTVAELEFKPELAFELKKWQPKIEFDVKYDQYMFKGPSYYDLYPEKVPIKDYTLWEKFVRKYSTPLTYEQMVPKGSELDLDLDVPLVSRASQYRTKLLREPSFSIMPKPVYFFSSPIPVSGGKGAIRPPLFFAFNYPVSLKPDRYGLPFDMSASKYPISITPGYKLGGMPSYPITPVPSGYKIPSPPKYTITPIPIDYKPTSTSDYPTPPPPYKPPPYKFPPYKPPILISPPYKPPPYKPPYFPPMYPLPPEKPKKPRIDDDYTKRLNKMMKNIDIGYRFRKWETPSLEDFLKI